MSTLTVDLAYPERNRFTVGFRMFTAIPHLIIAQGWGYLAQAQAQALALVQWFIVLFTGKRNDGILEMQRTWLGYYARALSYVRPTGSRPASGSSG